MDTVIAFFVSVNDFLKQPHLLSLVIRLVLAMLLGACIGFERGKKRRAAGLRTHMLVCLGAALTMVISQYLITLGQTTDVSRLGAQVINGVGFLGAGSIIVTGRLEVKGLTTAATLWASACMGLAVGAGFIFGALCACVIICITTIVLAKLEMRIMANSRNMNISVEYSDTSTLGELIEKLKGMDIHIFDIELTQGINPTATELSAILDIKLPAKFTHAKVMTSIAEIPTVKSVEEL